MKILKKVEFNEVLSQFHAEHDLTRDHHANTNRAAEKILVCADTELQEWTKVLVTREDILRVILPWHIGCGGKIHLVPKSGLTVKQVVEKLSQIKDSYAQESPVCWNKIVRMSQTQFTPLFLSTQVVTSAPDYAGYKELHIKEGLIHLDGLHRMISWELNGRLADNLLLEAYIAGDLSSHIDL